MDDREEYSTPANPEGIAKIIVFALVSMIVITSVALPVLASVGERTGTESNTGVRMSCLTPEDWEDMIEIYDDSPVPTLRLTGIGLYISGRINGVSEFTYLVHSENYNTSYPIAFEYIHENSQYNHNERMYVLDTDTNRYTCTYYSQTTTGSSYQINPPVTEISTSELWYQDPNGSYIMNTGDMNISSGSVLGIHIEVGKVLVADLERAKYVVSNVPEYGDSTVDKTSHGGYETIESISYSGTDCTYYIGPINYTVSENVLEGTPMGAMIGIIPTLMIIGIVVFIAKSVRRSDR